MLRTASTDDVVKITLGSRRLGAQYRDAV